MKANIKNNEDFLLKSRVLAELARHGLSNGASLGRHSGKCDLAEEVVREMPAETDVVRVIRCKNCIHYFQGSCLKIYDDGAAHVNAWQGRQPDDFCSYGERDKVAKPVSKIYGKWISPSQNPDIVNKEFFSDCSVCHASSMDEADTCPHCGAVMMNSEVPANG